MMTKKIFIFTLISILLLNSTSCLRRATIQPESAEIESQRHTIYVYMKPGAAYLGNSILKLKDAKVDDNLLTGMIESEKAKIPLGNIESIEVLRLDKKRVVIASMIIATLAGLGYAYGKAAGSASVD